MFLGVTNDMIRPRLAYTAYRETDLTFITCSTYKFVTNPLRHIADVVENDSSYQIIICISRAPAAAAAASQGGTDQLKGNVM